MDGEMSEVSIEALLITQGGHKRSRSAWINRYHAVAIATDEVEMGVPGVGVIGRGPIIEVSVADQADLFKDFEGAIDGRNIDGSRLLADLSQHLIWGGVS